MGDVLHSIVDLGYARYQGNMNKATRNVELLGVPYAAVPTDTPPPGLLRPFTNRVFTGDAQSQPPEVTAGIKMADTESCTYWLPAAVGRLSFSQVRSETQLVSFYLFMRFSIVAPRSSKKGLPVVVWFHGFVILVIFLQMTALEAS